MTDYALTAAVGALALLGGATDGQSRADAGMFTLAGGATGFSRSFAANLGDLTLKLDPLKKQLSYYNPDGTPTIQGMLIDQRRREAIEAAFNRLADTVLAIQAAYNAAAQASAAASEASSAAVDVRGEVASVVDTVAAIEAGTYNFPAITIGGAQIAYGGNGDLIIP